MLVYINFDMVVIGGEFYVVGNFVFKKFLFEVLVRIIDEYYFDLKN